MPEISVWITIGVLATVVSVPAVSTRLFDTATQLVFGAIGMVLWGIWGLGATDLTVTTSCCVTSHSYNSIMVVGLLFAVLMLYTVFKKAPEVLRA